MWADGAQRQATQKPPGELQRHYFWKTSARPITP